MTSDFCVIFLMALSLTPVFQSKTQAAQCSCHLNLSTVLAIHKEAHSMYHLMEFYHKRLRVVQSLTRTDLVGEANFQVEKLPENLISLYTDSDVALLTSQMVVQQLAENQTAHNETIDNVLQRVSNDLAGDCLEQRAPEMCGSRKFYRPLDGTCSNLDMPNEGAANTAYSRLRRANYHDKIKLARKSVTGKDLPLARRLVTSIFLSQQLVDAKKLKVIPNANSIMFGQLVTHDVGSKQAIQPKTAEGANFRCCSQTNGELPPELLSPACMPIIVPKADEVYSNFSITCLNNIRSQTVTPFGCPMLGSAQQINGVTSLLDLSVVYGSSKADSDALRTMQDGQFKLTKDGFLTNKAGCNGTACFLAGDARSNQTPFLQIWHLIWYREHNRIAKAFKQLNPFWSDQTIFQETRRLVIAIYQHSVYNEYLPAYLSEKTIRRYNLAVGNVDFKKVGLIDGRTTNEFSHAIFRRFHNLSPGAFEVLDDNNQVIASLEIADVLQKSQMIEKLYNQMARGMLNQTMSLKTMDEDYSFKLFQNSKGIGLDLFSIDITRGRDHGLAPYHVYRKKCDLKPVKTFDDLYPSMSRETIAKLKEHYESVLDIDLAVGAGLEELNGEILGPTIQCIMGDQFYRYKFGDPYFYTNDQQPHHFTKRQMKEIKKFTIARLFCDNSDLKVVPANGFLSPSSKNPMRKCDAVTKMDLKAWRAIGKGKIRKGNDYHGQQKRQKRHGQRKRQKRHGQRKRQKRHGRRGKKGHHK